MISMPEAEVEGCEPTHGQTHHMGACELQVVQHRADIVGCAGLAVL